MDLRNKTELELYFADHFDTMLFPVLADFYLIEGDLMRARKVCEIGLKYHPNQVDGLFVLANVDKEEGDLLMAEKKLMSIKKIGSLHLQAAEMLADIQTELGRSKNTIGASWKKVMEIDPHHVRALEFSDQVEAEKQHQKAKKKSTDELQSRKPELVSQSDLEEQLDSLSISPRLATFTLVAVLKNQGLYHQALDVLDLLEQKGVDPERIVEERKAIQDFLQINES